MFQLQNKLILTWEVATQTLLSLQTFNRVGICNSISIENSLNQNRLTRNFKLKSILTTDSWQLGAISNFARIKYRFDCIVFNLLAVWDDFDYSNVEQFGNCLRIWRWFKFVWDSIVWKIVTRNRIKPCQ